MTGVDHLDIRKYLAQPWGRLEDGTILSLEEVLYRTAEPRNFEQYCRVALDHIDTSEGDWTISTVWIGFSPAYARDLDKPLYETMVTPPGYGSERIWKWPTRTIAETMHRIIRRWITLTHEFPDDDLVADDYDRVIRGTGYEQKLSPETQALIDRLRQHHDHTVPETPS